MRESLSTEDFLPVHSEGGRSTSFSICSGWGQLVPTKACGAWGRAVPTPVQRPNVCKKDRNRPAIPLRFNVLTLQRFNVSTPRRKPHLSPTFRLDGGTVPPQKRFFHIQKPLIFRCFPRRKIRKNRTVPFDAEKNDFLLDFSTKSSKKSQKIQIHPRLSCICPIWPIRPIRPIPFHSMFGVRIASGAATSMFDVCSD